MNSMNRTAIRRSRAKEASGSGSEPVAEVPTIRLVD